MEKSFIQRYINTYFLFNLVVQFGSFGDHLNLNIQPKTSFATCKYDLFPIGATIYTTSQFSDLNYLPGVNQTLFSSNIQNAASSACYQLRDYVRTYFLSVVSYTAITLQIRYLCRRETDCSFFPLELCQVHDGRKAHSQGRRVCCL